MAHSSNVEKTCFILVRYFVKRSKSICCIIRNEQGTDYTTCLHANGRTSCTCDAGEHGQKCYHVKHLLKAEQARRSVSATVPPAATLKTLPRAATAATFNMTSAQPADTGERGSLNSRTHSAASSLVQRKSSSELGLPAIYMK